MTDLHVDGAIGAKWNAATRKLAYGKPGASGHYQAFLADAEGHNETRLHYAQWPARRHEFPAAWHPSGRLLVMLVEKPSHPRSSTDAIPGYGAFTDYWAVTADGRMAWRLTDIPNDYDHAVTHAAFSPDGTKFVWTARIKAPNLLRPALFAGAYVFNVSDFLETPEPHLEHTLAVMPDDVLQGGEVESIAADNATIAFYSTLRSQSLFATRIYTLNVATNERRELTSESWAQAPTFTPDGQSIVYMTGAQADIFPFRLQGADWWIMNVDGTNKRRLTFMNVRNHPQSTNQFRLAGSVSFDSDRSFYGDVMTRSLGLVGKIVRVQCEGSPPSVP